MGLEDTKQMPNKADLRWNKGNIQNSLFFQKFCKKESQIYV